MSSFRLTGRQRPSTSTASPGPSSRTSTPSHHDPHQRSRPARPP
jgi:hypothetical protein